MRRDNSLSFHILKDGEVGLPIHRQRMVPTHATKAGVRYRYYVSLPLLHGESKTASVGSVFHVPATDIENIIVKSLNEHLIAQKEKPAFSRTHVRDGKAAFEQVARLDVYEDRLAVRLKSADDDETSHAADDYLLSIPWQKPPSRKSRQILVPHGIAKTESAQRGSNVECAWSAPSPEVVARLTKLFRARSLTSSRSQHVKNAVFVRST